LLTRKLLDQGFLAVKLKTSLRNFHGRYKWQRTWSYSQSDTQYYGQGIIRSCKWQKDTQYYGQTKKTEGQTMIYKILHCILPFTASDYPLAIVLCILLPCTASDYSLAIVLCILLPFTAYDYPLAIVLCILLLFTASDYPLAIVLCILLPFTASDYPLDIVLCIFLNQNL
jgi:hypothetical protein